MAKYGKWIGGGLGWAFGGPIGGILGFIFGSMYDSMNSGKYEAKTGQTQGGDFSASLLVLTAAMMKADGKVVKSELEFVKQFFNRQFGAEAAKMQIKALGQIVKQEIPVNDVCDQIRHYMDHSSKLQLMHYLWGIAAADNEFPPAEIRLLEQIASRIGINTHDFNSIKAMFIKDIDSAFKILEVSPRAGEDEIKKAYRKMAMKYHPDKVNHLGDEFKKAAEEKFQKVNEAYETIKKQKGFN